MSASILEETAEGVTIKVTVKFNGSMLESEESIQGALNEAGALASKALLTKFDTDGTAIVSGNAKLTSKGLQEREYQTPYGAIQVARHVYQSSQGGRTFCPLEQAARIVGSATPRFAMQLSHKYAEIGSPRVIDDLEKNHGRVITHGYVQSVADAVASIALLKEEAWTYATPDPERPVAVIGLGMDGACMHYSQDGWREAMIGTATLYDREGERLHTIYIAASPEFGKETFLNRMEREISHLKNRFPSATYVGVADGAKANWEFLFKHTSEQILDFYHASEYLGAVAEAYFPQDLAKRKEWLDDACHRLKHEASAPLDLTNEINRFLKAKLPAVARKTIKKAHTYFTNNYKLMRYADHLTRKLPLGSGVTEAACKVIVKQRLCSSGMRWKEQGAAAVLSLRAISYSSGRWTQFWEKINQFGFPAKLIVHRLRRKTKRPLKNTH